MRLTPSILLMFLKNKAQVSVLVWNEGVSGLEVAGGEVSGAVFLLRSLGRLSKLYYQHPDYPATRHK